MMCLPYGQYYDKSVCGEPSLLNRGNEAHWMHHVDTPMPQIAVSQLHAKTANLSEGERGCGGGFTHGHACPSY